MDAETLAVAISIMLSMPDNALASAQAAQEAADSVDVATVEEAVEYLGIE